MGNKKAAKDLKDGLAKFKEEAKGKGWEDDEIEEKINDVFENFPWYKFKPAKRSWKSTIGSILLCSFILYLACGAVLQRNKRLSKKVNDFFFDIQYSYHQQRLARLFFVPFYKFYDFSTHHNDECMIKNPFLPNDAIVCDFCEGIEMIPMLKAGSVDIEDMIKDAAPFAIQGLPGYGNLSVGFDELKKMVQENREQVEDAICAIRLTDKFTKVGDYFDLTEQEVIEKNISIGWRNCDTYGTRFYRKLFPRPSFIPKTSEVYLEKEVYILQKGANASMPNMNGGESLVAAQVHGSSIYQLSVPSDCQTNCTTKPLEIELKAGEILVHASSSSWISTFRSSSDELSIVYVSSFT